MKYKTSIKEQEILSILWNNEQALTAKQIHDLSPEIPISTIQTVLKKLMKKKLVKIDDIIYSGKVLTRSYSTEINQEEFILQQYQDLNVSNLLSLFLGDKKIKYEDTEIENLEKLIDEQRKKLK